MPHVLDTLIALKKKQFTGQLILSNDNNEQWVVYVFLGRLLYGAGGQHSVRRLYRHLAKASASLTTESLNQLQAQLDLAAKACWEYEFLIFLVQQSYLAPNQIPKIIHGILSEFFFDIANQKKIHRKVQSKLPIPKQLGLIDPIQLLEYQRPHWERWKTANFDVYSLNQALLIRHPELLQKNLSTPVFKALSKFLDGQHTLWDMVTATGRSPQDMMQLLLPFVKAKAIEFTSLPDFSPPKKITSLPLTPLQQTKQLDVCKTTSLNSSKSALIACVDDSDWVCKTLERVVTRAGYRFLAIQDPLRAIPTLLSQRPQLILLDLLMPNTNGYEICSQLRRISAFRNTPIIILTGNDGIVDRVRAKLVGATDFLSKSVNHSQLMAALSKYVAEESAPPLLLEKQTLS
jgi:chemotaxis family two-component system response regulator PixG